MSSGLDQQRTKRDEERDDGDDVEIWRPAALPTDVLFLLSECAVCSRVRSISGSLCRAAPGHPSSAVECRQEG